MLSNTLGILTHEIEDWNRNTWDIPYVGAFENFGFTPDQGSWSSGIDDKALELWFPYFQTKQHTISLCLYTYIEYRHACLVGGLEHFLFSHSVGNDIIPTDFH